MVALMVELLASTVTYQAVAAAVPVHVIDKAVHTGIPLELQRQHPAGKYFTIQFNPKVDP